MTPWKLKWRIFSNLWSIVVLISTPSQIVTTTTIQMLVRLISNSSNRLLDLVKADLIPQIIITLNPLSLSFAKAVDVHVNLLKMLHDTLWLSTVRCLAQSEIEDRDERHTVHETILKQVLVPSEQYICHLCMNRCSIINDVLSAELLRLLAQLLDISRYHQPTMYFVLHMPVGLTISSASVALSHPLQICWEFAFSITHSFSDVLENAAERCANATADKETKVHNSPPAHLTACVGSSRQHLASRFVALAYGTLTDDELSPHSSPTPTQPDSREGRDTRHIVSITDSMCRCYVVTARTAGDTGIPVVSTTETEDERTVEREGEGRDDKTSMPCWN
ncbi:hypothetical protein BLNAU_5363 [Blattamonas nauphoetae]|uniref:Secreted protein n=1 Tax=Blattamonas nauphoetae TaxID=2049346 RepID=A0ABQ9Y7B0_9EUKA|nr:hypothetical protein BLNAU_5363 [Blattamonas nauphoetae]